MDSFSKLEFKRKKSRENSKVDNTPRASRSRLPYLSYLKSCAFLQSRRCFSKKYCLPSLLLSPSQTAKILAKRKFVTLHTTLCRNMMTMTLFSLLERWRRKKQFWGKEMNTLFRKNPCKVKKAKKIMILWEKNKLRREWQWFHGLLSTSVIIIEISYDDFNITV